MTTHEISTTEALMTDPTTPEGAAYWQERHDYEAALERITMERCTIHLFVNCPLCRNRGSR